MKKAKVKFTEMINKSIYSLKEKYDDSKTGSAHIHLEQLLSDKIEIDDLRGVGATYKMLFQYNVDGKFVRDNKGVDSLQLYNQGVSSSNMDDCGISPKNMLDDGMNISEIYSGGVGLKRMFEGGITKTTLTTYALTSGGNPFTHAQIIDVTG
ncbi:MAG: hypothetical protein HRT87_05080 [Legionellales bacterium]|nr:hypothetical protein [Legionellales bacterium]